MSEGVKRLLYIVSGAIIALLWYRTYSDPLAVGVMLVGVGIAWAWSKVRGEHYSWGHVAAGATVAMLVTGALLRILIAVDRGDASGPVIGGLLGQGAFFAAALVLIYFGISVNPLPSEAHAKDPSRNDSADE